MEIISNYLADKDIVGILISVGLKLVLALVVFQAGRWIGKWAEKTIEALMKKRGVDEILFDFIGTIVNVLIVIVAVVAAMDILGIPATSLVAVLGAAGLAVGLALKDSLANFAAGVMLVIFRPFTKGDYVEVANTAGTVDEVWLVSTRLVTPDNKEVIIPNATIWSDNITNYSARDTRRLDMVYGVGYDDDLKLAASVLRKICEEHPLVLEEPAINIFVTNLGDSSVDFAVRPWVKTTDYWAVRAEIMERAKVDLEAAGCSIPYPQQDVHLHQDN
jgi:small conductance mechanosensitive channel